MRDKMYEIQSLLTEDLRTAQQLVEQKFQDELILNKPKRAERKITAAQQRLIDASVRARDKFEQAIKAAEQSGLVYGGDNPLQWFSPAAFRLPIQNEDLSWQKPIVQRKEERLQALKLEHKKARIVLLAGSQKDVFELLNTFGDTVMAIAHNRKQLSSTTTAESAVTPALNENADIEIDIDKEAAKKTRRARQRQA